MLVYANTFILSLEHKNMMDILKDDAFPKIQEFIKITDTDTKQVILHIQKSETPVKTNPLTKYQDPDND